MKRVCIVLAIFASFFLTGCTAETTNIDINNDTGKAVMGLDYRDFDKAASQMVQSLMASGALTKKGGGRYVVATGKIVNDTMQRIDTDELMAKVEQEMTNSGKVVITSAVGGNGASDDMIYDVRELRDGKAGEEFDQKTVAGKGQLIAPELSLSGKIIQRDVKYNSKEQQVEYYFQLRLTDLATGLRFWQNETVIGKRGSNKSVSW